MSPARWGPPGIGGPRHDSPEISFFLFFSEEGLKQQIEFFAEPEIHALRAALQELLKSLPDTKLRDTYAVQMCKDR